MQKSRIEYLAAVDGMSWNPIRMLCSSISAGCTNCWHLRMAHRMASNPLIPSGLRTIYDGKSSATAWLDAEELDAPRRRKKPTVIAVQFMGDLCHDRINVAHRAAVWRVMVEERRHTFLVLTKRPENLWRLAEWGRLAGLSPMVPDNIWLGVSVEDQAAADERIPLLLQTPAAKHWVSVEPMLGPVDLKGQAKGYGFGWVDWVVCGAETGPHKRPCRPEWIDSLRSQCKAAGVRFFGKVDQDGEPIAPREMPT